MRHLTLCFLVLSMFAWSFPTPAQENEIGGFSLETEPVAYLLGGAGGTAAYQSGAWMYSIEVYGGLLIPESLHENEGFSTQLKGVIIQAERFLSGTDGFYLGPEFGISRPRFTLESTGTGKTYTNYSVGLRTGYHWNTGIGKLYLSPVLGLGYSLNARDIHISDNTFENNSLMLWGTVGIGWSF